MTRAGLTALALCILAPAARGDLTLVASVAVEGVPAPLRRAAGLAEGGGTTLTIYRKEGRQRAETGEGVVLDDLATGDRYLLDPRARTVAAYRAAPALPAPAERLSVRAHAAIHPLAGERTLAGRRTVGYAFSGVVRLRLRGSETEIARIEVEGEQWSAPDLRLPGGGAGALLARLPVLGGAAQAPLTARLAALPGTPLAFQVRLRVVSSVGDLGGLLPPGAITARAEVTSFSQETLPDTLFQVPSDYRALE